MLTDRARVSVAEELSCDPSSVALVDNATQGEILVPIAFLMLSAYPR